MEYLWLLIPFAILIAATEFESFGLGFVGVVVATLIAYFIIQTNPLMWIIANPYLTALLFAGYFAAGAIWSVFKWYLFLAKNQPAMIDAFAEFKKSRNYDDEAKNVDGFLTSGYNRFTPSKNKYRISTWLVWWVPSLFWTFTHDFFKAIWDYLYEIFSSLYDRMSSDRIRRTLDK